MNTYEIRTNTIGSIFLLITLFHKYTDIYLLSINCDELSVLVATKDNSVAFIAKTKKSSKSANNKIIYLKMIV